MKIYISTDMEGISGINMIEQVQIGSAPYEAARKLLCDDINVAIAGAYDGGATEVVVLDGHGGGQNLRLEMMDSRAKYETVKNTLEVMPSLDHTFGGLILVGCHAMAGTLNGFLDHTQSSASWFNFYVNGRKCGEIGQEGIYAGHFRVPVVMVTGDKAACKEGLEFFKGIEAVAVKEGLGRNRAKCLVPERAHEMIRESAARAVRRAKAGEFSPWALEPPIEIKLELYRSDYADPFETNPAVERLDARTVRKVIQSGREIFHW
ncbi:MAG: M55 family metallopeptidase [Armatimonadetes bacterium]|nr:M55 family metallopeptidase [Armatimonadota bacterium]